MVEMKEGMASVGLHRWPWTESYKNLNPAAFDQGKYPKISVIVPSYNQGHYLEETILSILNQNYPHLELIVIDGGSTDNSVAIIKKYEEFIQYWVSEKDNGQSHAINKGFKMATGEWIAWMNSDDCYMENALEYLVNNVRLPSFDFLHGACFVGNELSSAIESRSGKTKHITLFKLLHFFYSQDFMIPSQSVFVRRSFLQDIGFLNTDMHYCMDLEWYTRIVLKNPRSLKYEKSICFYRSHDSAKTFSQGKKMRAEAVAIALKNFKHLSFLEQWQLKNLIHYAEVFSSDHFQYLHKSAWSTFKLFLQHPWYCMTDRRFLGIAKIKLLGNR